jgi:hypothetical protein
MIAQRLKNNPMWLALRAEFRRVIRTKPPSWLPVAATAIPALLLLVQIVQNWVNIPYWDEWQLIAQLRISMQAGTLRLVDLFTQHNDSRFVIPHLLLLPLARLTHWDLRADMLLIFVTVCGISRLLWSLLGEIENLPRAARVACLLVCNCLLFSPIQYETFLGGMNLSLVLPPLFLLISLRINLSRRFLPVKVALNILLCFASTFANANGMGNWLLVFPGFVRDERQTSRRWLWHGIYFAAAIGTLLLFFWNYHRQAGLSPVRGSPGLLLKYFFCWVGAPLAISLGSSAWIAGVCLFLIFATLAGATLLWPESGRRRDIAYVFTAIGCYAGLAGAATALGRVGLRFELALSSRYTTFSIYLPIAVVCLAALYSSRPVKENAFAWKRSRQGAAALIVIVTLACSLGTYQWGMKGMTWTRRQRARGRAALLFSEVLPNNPDLKILSADPVAMIRKYRALFRCGMARDAIISARAIPPLEPQAGVDRGHGCLKVCELNGDRLTIKGWALREEKKPAPFVLLAYRARGQTAIPFAVAPTGDSTPGLIRRGLRSCGFRLDLEPDLPPGRVEISAWATNPKENEAAQLAALHIIELPATVAPRR